MQFIFNPPVRAGLPVCFIDAFAPHALPERVDSGEWFAHVLYVPEGMSTVLSSYRDILDAGGIDVAFTTAPERAAGESGEYREGGDPDALGGGYYMSNIRGAPAAIQRVRENRVVVRWHESASSVGVEGIDVELSADYSEQKLFNLAYAVRTGEPPNALPPLAELPSPAEPAQVLRGGGATALPTDAPASVPGEG